MAAQGRELGENPRGPRLSFQLAGASGRALHVEGVFRPVIALRESRLRGRALVHAFAERMEGGPLRAAPPETLSFIDLERIDVAAAERALAMLPPSTETRPPLLFLPVAWSTARNGRVAKRLLRLAVDIQTRLRMAPVCEIYALERGAPPSVMREVAGRLQPIFRGVIPRLSPDSRAVAEVEGCGFSGAAVEAGDLTEAADDQAMLRMVLDLQRTGPGVMFHGVRSTAALAAARGAGASWASLDIVGHEGARLAALAQKGTAAQSPGPPSEIDTA